MNAISMLKKDHQNIEMAAQYDVIHPQAQITKSDWEKINRILRKYDRALYKVQTYKHYSLYKIQTYKNGELISTAGTMDEKMVHASVSQTINEAQQAKFTGCAIQAGRDVFPEAEPSPSPGGRASTTRQTVMAKNSEMITELKPILEKYNNQKK